MINTRIEDSQVLDALAEIHRRGKNLRPVLQDLGEYFIVSTKARFASKKAPDGSVWDDNTKATRKAKGSNDPLVGASRRLSNEIHYNVSNNAVAWGSSLAYAGMQQFGGLKTAYPHLWGDIPGRPYLGVSDTDKQVVLEKLQEYLTQPTT